MILSLSRNRVYSKSLIFSLFTVLVSLNQGSRVLAVDTKLGQELIATNSNFTVDSFVQQNMTQNGSSAGSGDTSIPLPAEIVTMLAGGAMGSMLGLAIAKTVRQVITGEGAPLSFAVEQRPWLMFLFGPFLNATPISKRKHLYVRCVALNALLGSLGGFVVSNLRSYIAEAKVLAATEDSQSAS